MASGKTHAGITVVTSGLLAIGMWKTGYLTEQIHLVAAGCMSGIFLSPDMDVDAGFLGHAYVDKYLGKIVGAVWRALWWPYAILIPHRSPLSHAPVISTTLRLVYWYTIYVIACIVFKWPVWIPDFAHAGLLYFGLVASDVMHYIADIVSTSLKRRKSASLRFPMSEMQKRRRGRA